MKRRKENLKIAHISTVHRASDTRIYHKECVTLAEAGHSVHLIAIGPIPEWDSRVTFQPLPRPFRRAMRLANVIRATRRAFRAKVDVVHIHDPELILLGMLMKLLRRRVIYDAHEDTPAQIRSREWVPAVLRPVLSLIVEMVERLASRVFDGVIVATPSIGKRLGGSTLVSNYPILAEWSPPPPPESRRGGGLVYVGVLTKVRGASELVASLEHLDGIELTIAGSIPDTSLVGRIQDKKGWERVHLLGWLDREELQRLLARAEIGVIAFHPSPNHQEAYPTKLFEYMAAGLPVVASDLPAIRQLVLKERCGLLVDPLDPRSIADGVRRILDDPDEAREMGARGRMAIERRYNWGVESKALVDMYKTLEVDPG